MTDRIVPHGAIVLVTDGSKALFFINEGPIGHPHLTLETQLAAPENPLTHEQGEDKPGRVMMGSQHSAVEQTDWHRMAETDFARGVCQRLAELGESLKAEAIVLAAPPKMLGDLRTHLPAALRKRVVCELSKDLVKLPAAEIARHLMA